MVLVKKNKKLINILKKQYDPSLKKVKHVRKNRYGSSKIKS